MAMYPVRCTHCGADDDQYHRMPPAGGPPPFDACVKCGGVVRRVVTQVSEVGTGNRMHHITDRNLCPVAGPVTFNTRAEWQAEMKRRGVRPMESGEARDAARFEKERSERCEREYRKDLDARIDKAIDKAIDTIGGP